MIIATIDERAKTVVIRGDVVTLRINVDTIEINPRKKVYKRQTQKVDEDTNSLVAIWWRDHCPPGRYKSDQLYSAFRIFCEEEGIKNIPEKCVFLAGRHHNKFISKWNAATATQTLTVKVNTQATTVKAIHIDLSEVNKNRTLRTDGFSSLTMDSLIDETN